MLGFREIDGDLLKWDVFFEQDGCDALVAGGVGGAVEFDGHFAVFSASFGRMKLELIQMSFVG